MATLPPDNLPGSAYDRLIGLVVDTYTDEEVAGSLTIDPARHAQPYGIVHGGVWCGVVETIASIGAFIHASKLGLVSVGVENHTSFIRSVSEGTVRARGVPLQQGRTMSLWEVRIEDDRGRLVAHGKVRLALIERRGA